MSTLDDKILGEKTHYYCSSSEDESEPAPPPPPPKSESVEYVRPRLRGEYARRYDSSSTGPKGVIKDFQQYKQFESEQRESKEKEKLEVMKKLSLTCRSFIDEKIEQKVQNKVDGLDEEDDDENDPFIKEYIAKRMREMLDRYQQRETRKHFGELHSLNTGDAFLQILDDKELKNVLIVTHVYNQKIPECKVMNNCLAKLSRKYQYVKFCSLDASVAGMSYEFIKYGVPALLVYKNGDLVGNFVSLGDEFGEEFDENDIEDFLVENNILVSSQLISSISFNSNLSKAQNLSNKDSGK